MAKKARKKINLKLLIPVYILPIVVLALLIYVVPDVTGIFQSNYTVEYSTYEAAYNTEALVVRNERVYTSDEVGTIKRVAKEGKVLRANSRIVDVNGTGYHSGERGVICYSYDGLETRLTPDNMEKLSSSYIDKSKEEYPLQKCEKETAEKDSKIFKIVDNQVWYLLCWFDTDIADTFVKGNFVKIRFDENTVVKMRVYSVQEKSKNGKKKVIFSCNRYYDGYLEQRTVECKVVRSSINGIILETDSITEEDGVKGVYVANKYGKYNFTPVKVLAGDEKNTVVDVIENSYFYDENGKAVYTVKNYDKILRIDKKKEKEEKKDSDSKSEDKNLKKSSEKGKSKEN